MLEKHTTTTDIGSDSTVNREESRKRANYTSTYVLVRITLQKADVFFSLFFV